MRTARLMSGLGALVFGCVSPPTPTNGECGSFLAQCDPHTGDCLRDEEALANACGDSVRLSIQRPETRLRKDLDILFVIDNSATMVAKQRALVETIPQLVKRLEASQLNYHVGVTTSDVGTTPSPGIFWSGGSPSCNTYKGDDGLLQAIPCSQRPGLSAEAKAACAALCPDDRFVPPQGQRYVSRIDGVSNLPADFRIDPLTGVRRDFGPENALRCMAFVGDTGCGVTAPLEASKRALDGHLSENSGFLRPNSRLTVVYLSDEDDCSVQMSGRAFNNPAVRNCDPAMPGAFDCFNVEHRCFASAMACSESMLTPGLKTNCQERTDSYLEPLDKYRRFFANLRPVSNLALSGIWPLPSGGNGGRIEVVQRGGTGSPSLELDRDAGAACRSGTSPTITGSAQHRLSRLSQMFGQSPDGSPVFQETSICTEQDYPSGFRNIERFLFPPLFLDCLQSPPLQNANKQPLCVIAQVDLNQISTFPSADEIFPFCSADCCASFASARSQAEADPAMKAACASEGKDCACVLQSTVESICGGATLAGVWRRAPPSPSPKTIVTRWLHAP